MTQRTCSIDGCGKPQKAKRMCTMHYTRQRRGQDITAPQKRVPRYNGQTCEAPGCTEPAKANSLCGPHEARYRRHGDYDLRILPANTPMPARLDDGLPHKPQNGCWEWQKATSNGYGVVTKPHDAGTQLAHRAAFEAWVAPIPPNTHVLHTCDNPPCCNPAHLFLGDDQDNSDDKLAKKRNHNGERTYGHKLTDAQVTQIRSAYTGERGQQARLAEQYGVTAGQISLIVRGLSRVNPTNWETVAADQRLQASYPGRDWETVPRGV